MTEPNVQPSGDIFDITKIHSFSEIPLGHFAVVQTKVTSGKRLTIFTTKDRVKGYLLVGVVDKHFSLSVDEIMKAVSGSKMLLSAGGQSVIEGLVDRINAGVEGATDEPILIAEGVRALDGEDAKVDWKVDAGGAVDDDPTKIKVDEAAARVDYREVRKAVTVNAGDLILTITPQTMGQSGHDVFGKMLPAKDGRAKDFGCGEGVRTNEHRTEFHALETGHVSIENLKVIVSPVMKIASVDFNSGNVDYKGRVEVALDVAEGFKVTAGKELQIGGDVKDAVLKAGRSISAQAFLGKNCLVEAEGNIQVARIINATVRGKGSLSVTQEIINSDIHVAGAVNAQDAALVGSELVCIGPVYIGILGSPSDTASTQRVVIDPAALRIGELADIANKVQMLGQHIEKIKSGLGPIAEKRALANKLAADKKGMVTKLFDSLDIMEMQKQLAEKEFREKTEIWNDKVKPSIFVRQVCPGTKVTLLGVSKIFNEHIPAPISISLDKATKAIKITPWSPKRDA